MHRRDHQAAGVRLSCIEAGPPNGPLVLLLHGFPEDGLSWTPQIAALAEAGFKVVAPDQRGYGDSDRPSGKAAYGLERLTADVVALATALGHDRFDLVGHDWGGVVAWWVATRHPDRVRRLAVLNAPHPSAMAPYMRRSPSQALHSAYILAFRAPVLPEVMLRAFDCALLFGVLRWSSQPGAFTSEEFARYRRAWRTPGALTAMLNWYRALGGERRTGRARRVSPPTLVLWGARDIFLQLGLAKASAALCEDARIIVFDHASHWLQHEEPTAVNAELIAFLDHGAGPPEL